MYPGLIGIVSGLGPPAGNDVLDKALAYAAEAYGAVEDVDYPDIVLFSHGIEDFDSTGNIEQTFVRQIVRVVQEIEVHDPTVLGVACNTAHLHLAEVRAHTGAEVIDLVEETVAAESAFEAMHFDGIIAACTELPIAFDRADVSRALPVVDSNRVLAHASVDNSFRIRNCGRVLTSAGSS